MAERNINISCCTSAGTSTPATKPFSRYYTIKLFLGSFKSITPVIGNITEEPPVPPIKCLHSVMVSVM